MSYSEFVLYQTAVDGTVADAGVLSVESYGNVSRNSSHELVYLEEFSLGKLELGLIGIALSLHDISRVDGCGEVLLGRLGVEKIYT